MTTFFPISGARSSRDRVDGFHGRHGPLKPNRRPIWGSRPGLHRCRRRRRTRASRRFQRCRTDRRRAGRQHRQQGRPAVVCDCLSWTQAAQYRPAHTPPGGENPDRGRAGERHRDNLWPGHFGAPEIVICQGAFGTPQLLMLSGIGPAAHLHEHGIAPVIDLPGVGEHLADHVDVSMQYGSDFAELSHARHQRLDRAAMLMGRWLVNGSGPGGGSLFSVVLFNAAGDRSCRKQRCL